MLQARNVALADVFEARTLLEPTAVRVVASLRSRRAAAAELRNLIKDQRRVILEQEAFAPSNARFHDRLVALAGNQTMTIVMEMLNEVVQRAVAAIRQDGPVFGLGRESPPGHPFARATGGVHRDRQGG